MLGLLLGSVRHATLKEVFVRIAYLLAFKEGAVDITKGLCSYLYYLIAVYVKISLGLPHIESQTYTNVKEPNLFHFEF